jgi:hypothetical protein
MAVPKKFPSDQEILRIQKEDQFYDLYKSDVFDFDDANDKLMKFMLSEFFADDKDKMQLLTLALNIAPSIVRAGTNFLFGEDVKVEVDESSEKEAPLQAAIDQIILSNKLQRKWKESSRMLQAVGHTQFKFRKGLDGKAIIEEIPFDSWFPSFTNLTVGAQPTTFYVVSYLASTNTDGTPGQKYIYVEEHITGFISYSLWVNQGGKTGEQVILSTLAGLTPLNSKPDTANPLTFVEPTELKFPTVMQMDVDKDVKDLLGESILKQIAPLLDEINMRLTQISLQMLKHLDPIMEVPANAVPQNPDGKVDRKKLELLFTQAGDTPSRYVTNDNAMIEEAFKHLDKLILRAAKLTDTPQGFIESDEKGGVESAESIKARFMLFLKRVANYRRIYADGIREMLVKALAIQGNPAPADVELKITFDYGLPRDMEVDGRVWGQAVLDGVSSVETAVKMFQGIDGDLLDEEMARIKKDQSLVPPLNITQPIVAGVPPKVPVPPKKP